MKPRILITVEGGVIQHIASTEDMDIIIVDYDNEGMDENEGIVYETSPDGIFKAGKAHEMIDGITKGEEEVIEYLKYLKF